MQSVLVALSGLLVLGACSTSNYAPSASGTEAGVVETTRAEDILRQQIVINAPLEDVWDAFTTSDGYMAWASPFAHIELGVGGHIESSYDLAGKVGAEGNIRLEILAFIPEKLLVLKTVQAPAGFASQEMLDRLVSVFEFEPVGYSKTRITVSGIGYGDDEESDRLRNFFIEGNAWSLKALNTRFETGPTDWEALFASRRASD